MTELGPGVEVDGHYRIEAVAGRGGMGVVYRAHDERLERPVALKVAAASIAELPELRAGLLREARLTARVDHPGVVGVHHVGEVDGRPYVALQWIEGGDLRSRLTAGPLDVPEALEVLEQLASALDAAHAAGLLHRDVKPANVLVRDTPTGLRATLTDFGVAGALQDAGAAAAPADLVGTPAYLAPELAHGSAGDERSDLYGLGCVAFEVLTGTPPFVAATVPAMLVAHAIRPRPAASERRPELPSELDAVLQRAMAIDPAERFASGTELVGALHRALDLGPGGAPAQGLGPALRRARRTLEANSRLRAAALAAACVLLFGLALGLGALGGSLTEDPPPVNREGPALARGAKIPDSFDPESVKQVPPTAEGKRQVARVFADYAAVNRRARSAKDFEALLEGATGGEIWGRDLRCHRGDQTRPPGFPKLKPKENAVRQVHQYLWSRGEAPVKLIGLSPAAIQVVGSNLVWAGRFEDANGRTRPIKLWATRFYPRSGWGIFYVDLCPKTPVSR